MKNIIVTDIFGRTQFVEDLASRFWMPTEILDPYCAKQMAFTSEQEAYHFSAIHSQTT